MGRTPAGFAGRLMPGSADGKANQGVGLGLACLSVGTPRRPPQSGGVRPQAGVLSADSPDGRIKNLRVFVPPC